MSAVCGIFNLDGRPVVQEIMGGMLTAMNYWGPDGSGIWRDVVGGFVALGHLMLHSTPESVGDTLPRTNTSGNLVLTSHARIDNRDELFRRLNVSPSERAKMPDSTLILMAYQKWGQECPEQSIQNSAKRPLWRLIAGQIVKPLILDPLIERYLKSNTRE
jgi:asparagine synthase (glutamine-hydrolysing)